MQNIIKRLELIKASIELGDSDEFIKQQFSKLESEETGTELKQIIEEFGNIDQNLFLEYISKYIDNAKELKALEDQYQNLFVLKKEYVEKIHNFNEQYISKLGSVVDKRFKDKISEYQHALKEFENELEDVRQIYNGYKDKWDELRVDRSNIEDRIQKVDEFSDEYDIAYADLTEVELQIYEHKIRLENSRKSVKSKNEAYMFHPYHQKMEELKEDSQRFQMLYSTNLETVLTSQNILKNDLCDAKSLKEKYEIYEKSIDDIRMKIDQIKRNKDFIYIDNINDIKSYFDDLINKLDDTWIDRLWEWADENDIQNLHFKHYRDASLYTSLGYWEGIPRKKKELQELKELNIADYDLKMLPPEIGKLIKLESLYLGFDDIDYEMDYTFGNNLESLPSEIKNLQKLTTLRLSTNNFTFFPKEICALKNLESLEIFENNLILLSPEIGNLINLTNLNLSGNNLSILPAEIGNLLNLESLYLSYNNLSALPVEICNLTKLKILYIHDNKRNLVLTDRHKEWIEKLKNNNCNVRMDNNIIWETDIPFYDVHLINNNRQNIPIEIQGNWEKGWALDLHTLKSIPLGDGRFDTTYTDIGKALYELKYHQNYDMIDILVNYVVSFLNTLNLKIDVIMPTPPSKKRIIQPVVAIAEKISERLNIPIDSDYIVKNKNTSELKSIEDAVEREKILSGAFNLRDLSYENKNILLFDDLFRSGTTLKEITKTIYADGKVKNVYVMTLTQTRTKK